jgi:hypothetical protein
MTAMKGRIFIWSLVIVLAGLAACMDREPTPTSSELAAAEPTAVTTPTILPTNTAVVSLAERETLSANATPTPLPTTTDTPFPTPTATPTPVIPHLYVRGAHIRTSEWSPDSQWLAYWLSTTGDLSGLDGYTAPGGMLHFLNSSSGHRCALAQFRTRAGGQMSLSWEGFNRLTVYDWEAERQWYGRPCQPNTFRPLADPPVPPATPDVALSLSPDDRFRITLDLQEEEADNRRTLLTTLSHQDGVEITAVTWRTQTTFDDNDPGGEWLSPTQFFIRLAEAGPLLLDANLPGHVINVRAELFGLDRPAPDRGVVAVPGPTPDSFYLLLFGGRANNPIQLYHASSGLVETLPYHRSAWPPFSPDYQWLLMYEEGGNDLWQRRLTDVEGEWRLLGRDVSNNLRWNADATEVALSQFRQVTWQTFPEGELIGQWSTEPFISLANGWSPDGRFLVVMGLPESGWYRQALFLFERPGE